MKPLFALVVLLTLASCGADGMPEAPASMDSTGSGVTISGCAKLGVTMGPPTTGGPIRC